MIFQQKNTGCFNPTLRLTVALICMTPLGVLGSLGGIAIASLESGKSISQLIEEHNRREEEVMPVITAALSSALQETVRAAIEQYTR